MSCRSFRHVLALIHDTEADAWAVLERAVELADASDSELTQNLILTSTSA